MSAKLNDLTRNNHGLRVFCSKCGRCADLDVAALVERYGEDMPVPNIGKRSRCKVCGGKGGEVQVTVPN